MRTRPRHVSVWMNEEEYRHLNSQARLAGMGVDPFIPESCCRNTAPAQTADEYAALLRELSAIGNNINQIAHWANAQKSIREAEIVEAAVLAREAWRMVKEML